MALSADSRDRATGAFARFVHSEVSGSALLFVCTGVALGLANSPVADAYFGILGTKVGLSWGGAVLHLHLPRSGR